jgi:beta-glucanase (GH16 family)
MKNLTLLIIISCLAFSSCGSRGEDGWHLVWADEFDGEGLPDPEKWSYEVGYIRNNEKQYYTDARLENIRMENGHLVIEARKEAYEGFDYTSASINTWESALFTYGRFEIRAKLPTGRGTWPAIWMLGDNRSEVGWPACGEIDIMENVGYDPQRLHGYVHTGAYNHTRGTQRGNSVELESPWENFHVYAIEWFEDRIDFFIDDQNYFTFEKESDEPDVWPFDQPHYLLLNLAIGGGWGGQEGIDDGIFPQKYYIDYVRIYEWR